MANPFPGMNPYLEQLEFWSDCHNQLITAIARALSPQLVPKYRVVTDKWVYTLTDTVMMALGRPDVSLQRQRLPQSPRKTASIPTLEPIPVQVPMLLEMSQSYLQVKDTVTQAVVTVIEVLSPANKRGEGRAQYEAKRQQVLASQTHLVEIDLLRGGAPLMAEAVAAQWHYRLLVSRTAQRPVADLYAFNLPTPIPPFPSAPRMSMPPSIYNPC
ncbi:MAG: DUF4058 family protein [Leptolyngbya sp.]|nr:DUF4058 family protein [Leptolyngbya sp.]